MLKDDLRIEQNDLRIVSTIPQLELLRLLLNHFFCDNKIHLFFKQIEITYEIKNAQTKNVSVAIYNAMFN